MKKIFTLAIATIFLSVGAIAQCTPDLTITEPGLSPVADSLDCFVNGVAANAVIQFKNYDTVEVAGNETKVEWIKVKSINNLPCGLTWETNKSDNKFNNQENGCIVFSGTPDELPGQFLLELIVDAKVEAIPVPVTDQNAYTAFGLRYDLRVINPGGTCNPVDTSSSGDNSTCGVGIDETEAMFGSVSVSPNPVKDMAEISFNTLESGDYTVQVINILGELVSSFNSFYQSGMNVIEFDANGLVNGVYFYTISNGNGTITERIVVSN